MAQGDDGKPAGSKYSWSRWFSREITVEERARAEAYELLLTEAAKASEAQDGARFDQLITRLLQLEARSSLGVEPESAREHRMDRWRILVALVLIVGLIAAVIYALRTGAGEDAQTTAQYLSLVSGLAGIALGWLYGSTSAPGRSRKPRGLVKEPPDGGQRSE